MLTTIQKCLSLLDPGMRRQWFGLVPLSVFAALLETGGAVAIFLLVKIVSDPTQASMVPVVSTLAAWLPWQGEQAVVLTFTVCIGLFYLLKNSFALFQTYVQSAVANHSTATLSKQLFQGYLSLPYTFHFQRDSADLIRNITSSVHTTFRVFLTSVLSLATEALVVSGIIVVLLATAPMVTLLMLAILGSVGGLLLRLTQHTFVAWGEQDHELQHATLKTVQQSLGGIKELKISGREYFFYDLFATLQNRMARIRRLQATLMNLPRLLVETLFICGILLAIVLITHNNDLQADMIPLLGLYAYAGFRIIPSLNRILMHANTIQGGHAAVSQVYADLQLLNNTVTPNFTGLQSPPLPFTHQLMFEDVSFAYDGNPTPALQDIHVTVHSGESIGIVGPTGAGKSTLVNLLLGLLSPTHGRISVDDQDIHDNVRAWQRKIGYVPQEIYLLDDSLRRNIALGVSDAEIDEEKVQAALHMAQMESFVATLPQGLDTEIGERGIRLSGGQRQRVAIARALYHEPELLVFDEATSALDNQTEREITRAIDALHGKKTLIIVAHRLTTIRNCDRLLFLKAGKLVACETYDEMLATNADFRRMAAISEEGRTY